MTVLDDLPRVAELDDLELVELTQNGSREAVGELWLRHYPSTLRAASGVTRQPSDAEEITSEAFTAMMSACQNGHGPTTSVRAYLATSVRNIAARRATGPRSVEVPSDDPTRYEDTERLDSDAVARRAELGLVREAFSSLPDRWQTVLWRTAVDQDSHDRVAEAMGLSRNGVAALAVRARRALKVAYLQAHVSRGTVDTLCQPFLDQLAGLSQGARAGRDLQAHLDTCDRCQERLRELALVEQNVAGFLLPAVAILIPRISDLTAAGGALAAGAVGHTAAAAATTPASAAPAAAPAAAGATSGAPAAGATSGAPAAGATSGAPAAGATSGAPAAGAATGSRADSLVVARQARRVRQGAAVAAAAVVAVLVAGLAFALTRPSEEPAALKIVPTSSPGRVVPAPPTASGASPAATPSSTTAAGQDGTTTEAGGTAAGGTAVGGAGGTAAGTTGARNTPGAAAPGATTPGATTPGATTPGSTTPASATPTPSSSRAPTASPSGLTPLRPVAPVYAPATLGLGISATGTTVTVRPTATTGAPTSTMRLRLTVPAGVTLSGSSGAWTGCSQSGTTISCATAANAATSFTGGVSTAWPAGVTGTVGATVSGTTTTGAAYSASLGLPWPMTG